METKSEIPRLRNTDVYPDQSLTGNCYRTLPGPTMPYFILLLSVQSGIMYENRNQKPVTSINLSIHAMELEGSRLCMEARLRWLTCLS